MLENLHKYVLAKQKELPVPRRLNEDDDNDINNVLYSCLNP
jgi:hypothetical protein